MSVSVTLKRRGGAFGNRGFTDLGSHVETHTAALARSWALGTEYKAKATAHVVTGRMKASIKHTKHTEQKYSVTVGAPYGIYEEFGTRHREGHPFFTPAAKLSTKQTTARFRKILSNPRGASIIREQVT